MFQTELDGECKYANTYWQNVAGISMSETVECYWYKVIHESQRQRAFDSWVSAAEALEHFHGVYRLESADEEARWAKLYLNPILSDSGVRYVGTLEDITVQMQPIRN